MSTSFHPETDNSSEQSNKTVIEALHHFVNVHQSDWADHLIHVETTMNNSVNAMTSKTPTELLYNTPIQLFPLVNPHSKVTVPMVTDYIQRIQDSIALAWVMHAQAKTQQMTYANKHRRPESQYKIGDKVYLDTKNLRLRIKQKGHTAKFYPHFMGPFKIIKMKPETSTYKLELPSEYKIHPTFHARHLKLFIDNDPALFPNREST